MKLKKIKARLDEIKGRQKTINERQAAIEAAAQRDNAGAFSPEARAEYDRLGSEWGTLKAEKSGLKEQKKAKQKAKSEAEAAAAQAAARNAPAGGAGGRSNPNHGAALAERHLKPGTNIDAGGGGGNWATEALAKAHEHGIIAEGSGMEFRLPPRLSRCAWQVKNFKGTVNGRGPEERAYRAGMYFLAAIARDMPNRYEFPWAKDWVHENMGDVLNIAAGEYEGTTGAHFLIPEEFGSDMIVLRERFGVARRIMKRVPMTSDTRVDPRRKGGLTAFAVQQGAAGTESNMQWDEVRLTARDFMVLARYSNQLNADAIINLGDTLSGEIAYAFAKKEDDCGFNGDGSSGFSGIVGVRTRIKNWDGLGTVSPGLVTGTGGAWSSFVLADFESVAGNLPQYADGENTVWVCHRIFYYTVMLRLELAAGGVQQYQVAQGDRSPRPLFLGYPVEWSQVWPNATAATTVSAALGDFTQAASFGDRQQDAISFSEHASVGGQNVFERNQIAIRGVERFDINVHDVGGPNYDGFQSNGPIVAITT